jgi:hypothetical protein
MLAACASASSSAASGSSVSRLPLPPDSVLEHPGDRVPDRHGRVLMMENRSFDHYLGWLGDDQEYLDEGRRRYGGEFQINARANQIYRNAFGQLEHTRASFELAEWRFPGAPPQGPGSPGGQWYLTKRDRHANNFGASLTIDKPEPEVDLSGDLTLAPVAPDCDHEDRLEEVGHDDNTRHDQFEPTETLEAIVRQRYDTVSFTPWLRETNVRNVPVVADDRPR